MFNNWHNSYFSFSYFYFSGKIAANGGCVVYEK